MIGYFKKCFSINLNEFEQIGINLEINKVLLIACIAFGIFMILFAIYRNNIRTFVVQLMRHEATSEDKACTLDEIGLSNNKIIIYLISHNSMLTKIVGRLGAPKYSYEEYKALSKKERAELETIDFAVEKFYIYEDQKDRARHINEKYATNKKRMTASIIFLILVYVATVSAMPELLNLINNLLK